MFLPLCVLYMCIYLTIFFSKQQLIMIEQLKFLFSFGVNIIELINIAQEKTDVFLV